MYTFIIYKYKDKYIYRQKIIGTCCPYLRETRYVPNTSVVVKLLL